MALSDSDFHLIDSTIINAMAKTLHSIREIERWLTLHPDDPREIDLTRRKVDLEGLLALLRAKQDALQRQRAQLRPPTEAQIHRIANLSNEVEALQRQQMTADLLLSIGITTIAIANEVRNVGNG